MSIPEFTLKDLFEAGVHFGHRRSRWNPRMAPYLYTIRNDTHIIDIQQTVDLLKHALEAVKQIAAKGGRILFVGTKINAADVIKETALECGQYYVNHRWLGGMLTNWRTIIQSLKRLDDIQNRLKEPDGLTKKEMLKLQTTYDKLDKTLGGVRKMGGLPSALFIIDTRKEHIAIKEAQIAKIPVFAIVDSDSDPTLVTHPIPGNDDSIRSIKLYCKLLKAAILDGLQQNIAKQGIDLGELAEASKDESLLPQDLFQESMAEKTEGETA